MIRSLSIPLAVSAACLAFAAWNSYRYLHAGPLTTLTPYALIHERARLGGDPGVMAGIDPVLSMLGDFHQLLDEDMRSARSVLLEQLQVEVQLADATSNTRESRLRGLGVTAKALADLDRCEFDLRQAAALVSQLIIETGDDAPSRASSQTYQDFNNLSESVVAQLRDLARTAKVPGESWLAWSTRIDQGRQRLKARWGLSEDIRSSAPFLRDSGQEELGNEELEAIGKKELEQYRKAGLKPGGAGVESSAKEER